MIVGGIYSAQKGPNKQIGPIASHVATDDAGKSHTSNGHFQPISALADSNSYQYDRQKWRALIEFDPEIGRIEKTLKSYGQKYVDQFAAAYLVLNDKTYIPNILQKVTETTRQDATETKAAEERWGKRFADPAYVLKFAQENFYFLASRPYGNVAGLKDSGVLVERNGKVTKFPDPTTLRERANDEQQWLDMDDESKIRLVRLIHPYVSPNPK